jgi:hypothetical protein
MYKDRKQPPVNRFITLSWIKLGVAALALSGLLAIILVVARSPKIHELLPHVDLFKSALTIHVNLSVLIWLVCGGFFIFTGIQSSFRWINKIGLITCFFATIMVTLGIFNPDSKSYLNNYVPYMDDKIFRTGIWLFIVGATITAVSIFLNSANRAADIGTISGLGFSSIIIISALAFYHSLSELTKPENIGLYNNEDFYELLFWGGGHIIQFAYVQAMIAAWWILSGTKSLTKKNFFIVASALNLTFAAAAIPGLLSYDIKSFEYINYFTQHMIYLGGIAPIIAFAGLVNGFVSNTNFFMNEWEKNSLIWSIILFGSGGVLGFSISEINTVIPAHYHGSIVGVSLAMMGASYLVMRKYGLRVVNKKMATLQPVIYGSGQLIHIIGFAISGGYGALRKTPGAMESVEGKIYMGMMGLGGLISIIGGLLFVIVIFNSFKKTKFSN